SHFQERSGPHTLGVLFETVLPVSVIVAAGDGEKFDNFLHLAVLDDPAKSHHGNVVKWNHHLEAAGLNLQQVELFDAGAHGPAADLLDGSYAMVGVNDLSPMWKTPSLVIMRDTRKGADRKYYYLLHFSLPGRERQRCRRAACLGTHSSSLAECSS